MSNSDAARVLEARVVSKWGADFIATVLSGRRERGRTTYAWVLRILQANVEHPEKHCLLVGALADSFDGFYREYQRFVEANPWKATTPTHVLPQTAPYTIAAARTALLELKSKVPHLTPKQLFVMNPPVYRTLSRADQVWYKENVAGRITSRNHSVPDVMADRVALAKILKDAPLHVGLSRRFSALSARLRIRDAAWLRECLADHRRRVRQMQSQVDETLLAKMAAGAAVLKSRPGKPKPLRIGEIAAFAGLRASNLETKKHLKVEVRKLMESKEQYLVRQVTWALKELLTAEKAISPRAIFALTKTIPRWNYQALLKATIERVAQQRK